MSLRSAVNRKCKECLYDSGERGGWRQQIEACTSSSCPLFNVRPKPFHLLSRDTNRPETSESPCIPKKNDRGDHPHG